ncbi:MAG: Helix-turn-helix domain [Mycobacterium sp.]|nr:Helix-turn-helix domain [Mycobacterium sp.]
MIVAAGTTADPTARTCDVPARLHIAGTLLAFFRIRKGLKQGTLAEKLGVSERRLQDFEQGARERPLFDAPSAVIAEVLSLSGEEILELQSAHEADAFLRRIRKAPSRRAKARAFQSLMIMPVSLAREWLRVVLRHGTLASRIPASDGLSTAAQKKLDERLVDDLVLTELRSSLRDACEHSVQNADLAEMSQMLLYWARSLAQTGKDDEQRGAATDILRDAITKAKEEGHRIAWRHFAHAMCELDKDSGDICAYLVATTGDRHDERWNLDDLLRRSADRGRYVEAMECVVRFLEADMTRSSLPMCALDLRTASQILQASPKDRYGVVTSLADLTRTARLAQCLPAFLDQRANRRRSFDHECSSPRNQQCADLARKYAARIRKHLTVFADNLPGRVDEFRTTVAGSIRRAQPNVARRRRSICSDR